MRRMLPVPLAVAVALVLTACGDDDAGTTTAAPAAPATAAAPAAPAGDGVSIAMDGLQFEPGDVTVKAGTPVTWTNQEDIPHNVTAQDGADFESDTFGKGGTFTFTPKAAGTIEYVCTIHPGMDGTLTVEG